MRKQPSLSSIRFAVACCAAVLLAACAARLPPPPPVPVSPQFPDFVFPEIPAALQGGPEPQQMDFAWRWLQLGNLANADAGFANILKTAPAYYPAEAGLGFTKLAAKDYQKALEHFDRVLQHATNYAPALLGRGEALLALSQDRQALAAFEAALAANQSLDLPRRRIEVLRFRVLQANLSQARNAAEAGQVEQARAAYQQAITASPESGFLYRELAALERKTGDVGAAIEHLRKAVDLEPNDMSVWRDLGELFESQGDYPAAIAAYTRATAIEGDPDVQSRLKRLQALIALAGLPEEYRRIPELPALTRGELAALIGVHFEKLLDAASAAAPVVVTDTTNHWAAPWIFSVTRAGVIDEYPNHTFQPESPITRGDLAHAVSRLLNLVAEQQPVLAAKWKTNDLEIADVSRGNLNFEAVSIAVESGVLPLLEGGTFQVSKDVTGSEVVEAIERLEKLIR